jgi:hypothetical protein
VKSLLRGELAQPPPAAMPGWNFDASSRVYTIDGTTVGDANITFARNRSQAGRIALRVSVCQEHENQENHERREEEGHCHVDSRCHVETEDKAGRQR